MTALVVALAGALVALVAFSVRYAWWRPRVDLRAPRILMYHMVRSKLPGGRFNKLRVSPSAFERQLAWLSKRGWRFAFLSELAELTVLADLPERTNKTVVLTFDDGYRDNYLNAHPLLLKHGAKATLFLVADRHDRDWSVSRKAHHNSGELREEPKLTDDEVRAMLDSGVWELGSHTVTHAPLPNLNDAEKQAEIVGAKEQLQSRFNAPVETFAYPFGLFEPGDVDIASAAGFSLAVTTEPGISTALRREALTLKRIKVSGKDGLMAFALRMHTGHRGLSG